MNWISVNERLPDDDITVLIYMPGNKCGETVWIGYHDADEWYEPEGLCVDEVTHWMELPEPPEKE